MTAPEMPDEALTLSAQHLRAATVDVDGRVTALVLTDGEDAVEISWEIGNREAAAARIAEVGREMLAQAEDIRRHARTSGSAPR